MEQIQFVEQSVFHKFYLVHSGILCPVYTIHNQFGIVLLIRIRVGFSHLKEHIFNHNFQVTVYSMCTCRNCIESTINFFLHCAQFTTQRHPYEQNKFRQCKYIDRNRNFNYPNTYLGKKLQKLT